MRPTVGSRGCGVYLIGSGDPLSRFLNVIFTRSMRLFAGRAFFTKNIYRLVYKVAARQASEVRWYWQDAQGMGHENQ